MVTWTLEPGRENLHGKFSRDHAPVLTIDSGDTVEVRTLDAAWFLDPKQFGKDGEMLKVEPRDEELDAGHCLVGPIAIRGAKQGMTLEIRINDIRVSTWGWTVAGGWPHKVNERFGITDRESSIRLDWTFDPEGLMGRDQFGHEIGLRPFMGVMGMPPDEPGLLSTAPPRFTGGNLDCKELVAGTTLFLPIAVEGALFSVGDGHAVQGDGEVSVTAIECPMERVSLTFRLLDDMPLTTPRARLPGAWLTLGVHEDLHEATLIALQDMVSLMSELHGLEKKAALALASLAVDLRITQIANGVLGVHAVLADDAIRFATASGT